MKYLISLIGVVLIMITYTFKDLLPSSFSIKNINRNKNKLFTASLLLILSGCSSGPTVHNFDVDMSGYIEELQPPAQVIDAKIAVYYEPQTSNYVHEQAFSDALQTMNVGKASVEIFSKAIPMTFSKVERISSMPPYDIERVDYDGIIEPRIDYVNFRSGFETKDDFFHVEYTFILHTNTGVPISMWRVRGDGSHIDDQIKEAAQKFISEFSRDPETKSFRDYLVSKHVGDVKFDVANIVINTEIIDENPMGFDLISSDIIPMKISVTNNTGSAVTGRGYDVRLIGETTRMPPAFPLAVLSSTEDMSSRTMFDTALIGGAFGAFAMLGQSSGQHDERRTRVEYFDKARMKEVTLENGQSIEGKLFFIVPDNVQQLDNAELSLWFIDKAANNGKRKVVEVKGINYKRLSPEQLEKKADELKARQEAMKPDEPANTEEEF